MSTEQMGTYEKIYFALWELGQRYGNFVPVQSDRKKS